MFIIKIGYSFIILLTSVKAANGYKENLFLNLSKIENVGTRTIATYETNFTVDTFPLLLGLDDYITIEKSFGSNIISGYKHFANIKIDEKVWNLTMNFVPVKSLCNDSIAIHEFYIDDVLNEAFQCRNQVIGFKSRFYGLKMEKCDFFLTFSNARLYFYGEITYYWLITNEDALLLNNKRNFEEFLKHCISVSHKYYWLGTLGILIVLIFLPLFRKIKTPKMCIRRVTNTVIIIRPEQSILR